MPDPAKSTPPAIGDTKTGDFNHLPVPSGLTRDHLYDQIANRLQGMIVERGMRPGDRLPPERELCDLFGVSRTILREALKTLAARGFVSIEVGRGTFVSDGTAQAALDSLSRHFQTDHTTLAELHEARLSIEPTIAALAARRATAQDIQQMEQIVQRMAASVKDEDAWLQADQEFHQTLAEASNNRVLLMFVTSIVDLLQHARRLYFRRWPTTEDAVAQHGDVLDAVRAADAEAAAHAMQRHLQQVGQGILMPDGEQAREGIHA